MGSSRRRAAGTPQAGWSAAAPIHTVLRQCPLLTRLVIYQLFILYIVVTGYIAEVTKWPSSARPHALASAAIVLLIISFHFWSLIAGFIIAKCREITAKLIEEVMMTNAVATARVLRHFPDVTDK